MKTKMIIAVMTVIVMFLAFPSETTAQVKSQGPPNWAPANGFRANTRYVYFPERNFYYDTQKHVYIYKSGFVWKASPQLPSVYRRIDLIPARKVELDLSTDKPNMYNRSHKTNYKVSPNSKQVSPKNNPGKGNNKRK
jgi:hypothetical protein